MNFELSPAAIAMAGGAVLLVGVVLYLLVRWRRHGGAPAARDGDLLGLEQPDRPRRVPARPVERAVQEPTQEPSVPPQDPEVARLHERAKRRARTVVREIMMYNEEKLEKGRKEGNITKYLGREIEMSRKLYQASIDLSDVDSARYFDESLLNILAGGDASLLKET
jgi:hypothetical protein